MYKFKHVSILAQSRMLVEKLEYWEEPYKTWEDKSENTKLQLKFTTSFISKFV